MPLFEYKAVAANGETVQGTMEAATVEMVVLKLQEAGNIVDRQRAEQALERARNRARIAMGQVGTGQHV